MSSDRRTPDLSVVGGKPAPKANIQIKHMQRLSADRLIREIGADNLISTGKDSYLWNGLIWEKLHDEAIRARVLHQEEFNDKASYNYITSVASLVKSLIFNNSPEWDKPSDDIYVANGRLTWDGTAYTLGEGRREDYRRGTLPIKYDPEAKSPRFERFLDEIFDGDADWEAKKLLLGEAMGYSLIPSCQYERFFLLVGNGANGKSVFMSILGALVGRDLCCSVQPAEFGNRFQRGAMHGKLVNIVPELKEGGRIPDDALKNFVSGGQVEAEHKGRDPFMYQVTATQWFATNHMPGTGDFSDGIFRRAIIVGFNRTFSPDQQDPNLTNKLMDELPGVLNFALEGLSRLRRTYQFTRVESSIAAREEWRDDTDQVARYLQEKCTYAPEYKIESMIMYNNYRLWAEAEGCGKVARNTFSTRVANHGGKLVRSNKTRYIANYRIDDLSPNNSDDFFDLP